MKNAEAVATLRPRPCGPPLWGGAALRNGFTNRRRDGRRNTVTGNRSFHLNFAGSWSEIGGRRILPPQLETGEA